MNEMDILIQLAQRMTMVITVAFLLSRLRGLRRFFTYQPRTQGDVLWLILVFGVVAVLGTYAAISVDGALANSRVIGPVLAGLLGGPAAGLGAGLIGGMHRYLLGGFTGLACGISTVVEGLMAGLVRKYHPNALSGRGAFLTGLAAEVTQMVIILLVARPFEEAVNLVSHIGLAMILVNSLGLAVFVLLIQDIRLREEYAGALEAQKSLQIANKTLPLLRSGLHGGSAAAVAQVVREMTGLSAVALTDREKILAHSGAGEDHHTTGEPFMTETTRKALEEGKVVLASSKDEIHCTHADCPLASVIVVPLFCRDEIAGSLKLYGTADNPVTLVDQELAKGLGHLISTQLEIAVLEEQARLKTSAEIRALQAQIHPHFLFNALNTVASYVRTHPDAARKLLIQLGDFFRKNLREPSALVTLAEELEHIEAYLALEKARFEDRLDVVYEVAGDALDCKLPPLLLQPLVENAVRHGLLPLDEGGTVTIRADRLADHVLITISDDGVGIDPERIPGLLKGEAAPGKNRGAGIALHNVHERLRGIFGPDYGLGLDSRPGWGTVCTLRIPHQAKPVSLAS